MMTETKRMKSPSKSFDVFEFKEEDELTEMAVKKIAPKCGYPHALDVSGTEIQPKEDDTGICGSADAAVIDYNHDAAGSFTPIATENFAEAAPESSHDVHNYFKGHGAAEIKSNIIESGSVFSSVEYGSSAGATVRLEDHPNCAFPKSLCNDKSVHLASDADECMSERSPSDIANNNASSDGPSSDNCFGGWDLGDERVGIVFYPDYIDYRGTHYLDSVVSFSRSYVEARSKTIYGNEETFHIHLEIEDIFKIESQWSARSEAGTINIYFISKDAAQDDIDIVRNASGLQELKFPAVDSNWYKKQEAIESLDVRYKALWNVLLDTGTENCSALPEGEARMPKRSYFPNFDRPFEEVIYPKGDPDAVSISKRDVDLLLPDTFVNDTIIDFYIKYLKTRQNVDERTKFHFFNSFFFRKLADMDKDPSSAFDGKAAFQRVRKWTRKVNLLEKDFIFIPVNYNYHWSLIVICYFGEVASYKEEDGYSVRVPCILHMDSLRGNHIGLKDLMQSYLWEEWKERQKGTCEDLYSKFRNLKFVPLELPQQQNSYDCGLFLLHYVELFLEEVPANFSIYKITSSSKFLQEDWFPPGEASMKRTHMERLINGLLDNKSEDCPPSGGSGMHCSPEDLNTTHDYEDGVEFSGKSGPLGGCYESSLCQVRRGIEMTLLPASSVRSSQCTGTSGLVLKELFKQASASKSFNDVPWGALESRASLYEFKKPSPLTEEEVEASECFVTTELAEPVFQDLDGVTREAPAFPYSSEDFRLEPVHQPTSDDVASSPVTSGCDSGDILEVDADKKCESIEAVSLDGELYKRRCLSSRYMEHLTLCFAFSSGEVLNAEESQSLVEISDQNGDSFFLKNLSEFGQEANQLHNHAPSHESLAVCPAFASGDDKMDVSESESPYRMVNSNDKADPCILPSNYSPVSSHQDNGGGGHEWVSESDEEHAAKRMRITPIDGGEELTNNLSEDLHL